MQSAYHSYVCGANFIDMNPKTSLAIGIICIAFSPIFIKLMPLAAIPAAFYRLLFAWLFLAPYCLLAKNLRIGKKDLLIATVAGLVFALDIASWNMAIQQSTATIATLIANLTPLWVGLLTLVLYKKQPGASFWLGALIALCGMVVLLGLGNLLSLRLNPGILFAAMSSVFYAIYILTTRGILQRVDTLVFMFYNMLAAALFLGLLSLGSHAALTGFSARTWLLLIGLGLLCQLLGWITINYAIRHIDSTQVSIALLSQTVATGLLAWWILGEAVNIREILGGMLVLAGIGFTFLKRCPRG
ncbi:protein of unknown function DUF6 transmembrane [Mucilaginibacter paludis DSM 18603]|uniref:EamA domain-containing protein n=2 Tax=Mucilaginibacter TaxID=423349 RepID=H1Y4J3_9SPHI|nr:protein of unknown function DUF6 transmembrane [Mucilaginibacter paludis DSM 18603]